jgi:hypothetical protein
MSVMSFKRFCCTIAADSLATSVHGGTEVVKATKLRPWTKEDVRMLKTLARWKVKTTVIARRLRRSVEATYQKAMRLRVTFGGG